MYKSPVSITETAVRKIVEERDNEIICKIQSAFDVDVDKGELIRALQYDRNQYEKGYADGKADAIAKWIPVTERLPERNKIVLAWCDNAFQECCYHTGYCWETAWDHTKIYFVTHWMPLPEPPSGERKDNDE